MKIRKQLTTAVAGLALAIGSTQLLADPPQNCNPGMMGGYRAGAMGGYGPGYGMNPGMMPGYGPSYFMRPGMMWGYGPGLNLSDDQQNKITKIQDELRRKQWDLMGKIQDEFARRAEAPDDATASSADDRIGELQQQMISNATAARKQIDGVLSKEQRQQLRRGGY
ncbi:MAG TPA: Spy/CpxP family protein refolding chaperone [Burkholderiales bacterium]|nr:Spy/CpxP family protein refolding chaperone [Burkholderiales bacterium]